MRAHTTAEQDQARAVHAALTSRLGFGLKSDLQLRRDGGMTWRQIHLMADVGLLRVERVILTPGLAPIIMYLVFA